MTVWFTSDHHLGHKSMAWFRKYGIWPDDTSTPELIEWHDNMLAGHWDAVVKKDDVVWVLGDITLSKPARALSWFEKRTGTKHLILGNHDVAHPMHKNAHKYQGEYFRAFESVQVSAKRLISVGGGRHLTVLLSHFPYVGDSRETEDRCSQWRLPNEGLPILHGHVHTAEKVTFGNSLPTEDGGWFRPKQVHVGLDAWDYFPVSMEQVGELLA